MVGQIMRFVFSTSNPRIVFSTVGQVPLVNTCCRLGQWIFDSYRPEVHYMRGPGPKWLEKHAHVVSVLSIARHQ
jgi:hypothetical protein